ncbi:MAG: UDP-N-acetylmuramate dehydrogenase [Patescibacteria group bacterium]|nr:UDP-N-acetylmuramate dehydrogenase [Patescibacteria group bacterium]
MLEIKKNITIAPHTSIKIGGPALYFAKITDPADLIKLFKKIKTSRLPFVIIGGLSNLLFDSRGFKGWIIKIDIQEITQKNNQFIVGAGAILSNLIQAATLGGYGGLHRLIGIPGTVGGAIRGNAGRNNTQISDFLTSIRIFDAQKNKFFNLDPKDCRFQYRSSLFSGNPHHVIIQAVFSLEKKQKQITQKEIEEIIKITRDKPYNHYPSAGSIFKNISLKSIPDKEKRKTLLQSFIQKQKPEKPQSITAIPAGFLIESAGLKGAQINQAQISPQHGNIIINLGRASSSDVLRLIELAKEKVKQAWNIELEEEIIIIKSAF